MTLIDVATNTPGRPIAVGSAPRGVAVTPDGATAYVTNDGDDTVTPVAVATNTPAGRSPLTPVRWGSRSRWDRVRDRRCWELISKPYPMKSRHQTGDRLSLPNGTSRRFRRPYLRRFRCRLR